MTEAKAQAKDSHYRRLTILKNLQKDRKEVLVNPCLEYNDLLHLQEAILVNQIEYLERINSFNGRAKLKAKITLHGEKLEGVWLDMYKARKPWDTIFQLAKPDTTPT